MFADSGRASSEILEWLQEFRKFWWMMKFQYAETLTPVLLILSLEPTSKRREDLGKDSVYTHFFEDRNCEICEDQHYKGSVQKTRWRSCTSAEIFGDLITADHKVLSENFELRNNHRFAVVV